MEDLDIGLSGSVSWECREFAPHGAIAGGEEGETPPGGFLSDLDDEGFEEGLLEFRPDFFLFFPDHHNGLDGVDEGVAVTDGIFGGVAVLGGVLGHQVLSDREGLGRGLILNYRSLALPRLRIPVKESVAVRLGVILFSLPCPEDWRDVQELRVF